MKISKLIASCMLFSTCIAWCPFNSIDPASSVSGEATLLLPYFNDREQHFSFHATKDSQGAVSGSWESKSPGQEGRTHGKITCLVFLDDKTAYMTGVVEKVQGDGLAKIKEGATIWFKVKDNGEGKNAQPDEFTDYYISNGVISCRDYPRLPSHPIIGGNVQVKR